MKSDSGLEEKIMARQDLGLKVKLKEFMPYRLNNLAERVSVALSRIYSQEFDVSIAEWRILATLAEHPNLLAKEIGQQTHMDKVKVSRAVSALDRKLCLHKQKDAEDSRAIRLQLNEQGRALYEAIALKALAWEQKLLEELNVGQRATLYELLNHLDERVTEITR